MAILCRRWKSSSLEMTIYYLLLKSYNFQESQIPLHLLQREKKKIISLFVVNMESDFTHMSFNGILKFLSQTTLTNSRVSPPIINKLKLHLSDLFCAMEGFKARIQQKFRDCLRWGGGQQAVIFGIGTCIFLSLISLAYLI